MSFKLLAIRPLEGCDKDYLKILEKNMIYQFYNDYKFILDEEQKEVLEIKYTPTIPENLFNVSYDSNDLIHPKKEIEINISAVVGKNGSGKSTLSELFVYAMFIVSIKLRFIHKKDFLNIESEDFEHINEILKYDQDVKKIQQKIYLEFYYLIDNQICILNFSDNNILIKKADILKDNTSFGKTWSNVTKRDDLIYSFYYSMLVNYSMYAFNSNQIGIWIKSIFHKNDGYQTPIVINPYRKEGNIDVNSETYLTRSRLLANIISIEDYRNINSKSKIKTVELYRDRFKYDNYIFLEDKKTERFTISFINKFRKSILIPLFEKMFSYKDKGKLVSIKYPEIKIENFKTLNEISDIRVIAEIYLINKLITIPVRYELFRNYDLRKNKKKAIVNNFFTKNSSARKDVVNLIHDYINDLYEDRSHVTLKIRQTMNFIRLNIFNIPDREAKVDLDLISMVKAINEVKNENIFTEMIDYAPPPFLFSEIIFEDLSDFTKLSSGEKQQIFSLNSIIYHFKNLDSVHKRVRKKRGLIEYDKINLLLDEIELYFHPEFQKSYISNLLKLIESAKFENIKKLNILFLTHSPFILSDIPKQNILYLKTEERDKDIDGEIKKVQISIPQPFKNKNSFGANITDLLSDSFFIENGLIGDFAKGKINEVITWLNDEKRDSDKKDDYKKIIEMIDEPMIKYKLVETFHEVFPDERDKEEEIKKFVENAKKLGFKIIKE
jgi:predicted ATPase